MTWKGGDFMGVEDGINRMIWEGSPVKPGCEPTVKNCRFPESADRTRAEATEQLPTVALAAKLAAFSIPAALEIATSTDSDLERAINTMDWESGYR